jgi:CheY-like chemotaxis protein
MDVQMPEVDGLQAAAVIRTMPGLAGVPIIALTAHAMQGDRDRCLAAGMDDYLAKPLDMKKLIATVESAPHLRKVGEAG